MPDSRPAIPVELKRIILVEAWHRCAIPTCRATQVEIAHIVPWAEVKEHTYENLITLCPNCHTRFDRGEMDRKSMLMYKDNLRFFIEKYSKFELDVLLELAKLPPNNGLPILTAYMSLLIKAILDDWLAQIVIMEWGWMWTMGVKTSHDILIITEKWKQFVQNLSQKSIWYKSI